MAKRKTLKQARLWSKHDTDRMARKRKARQIKVTLADGTVKMVAAGHFAKNPRLRPQKPHTRAPRYVEGPHPYWPEWTLRDGWYRPTHAR